MVWGMPVVQGPNCPGPDFPGPNLPRTREERVQGGGETPELLTGHLCTGCRRGKWSSEGEG